ncbi:hypothetical protein SA496_14630 [Pseudomonas sp. JS3066]|jgi:hypothetical protein|uniref:hypothetical protein n=1 Tax=unclassified Pseudomonas TaxID=196821 RepID=UPI000EA9BC7E|nr:MULTISPECIES: hypothetical protein [unclassified Pseudomonas]AYF86285.1 hypothetical protein D6Z43_03545 [Pseudomonas sp. DY-1]MDH4653876.1 hypothetical protein [Pseudomonas sp. BN606]MRK22719.1 hypothetical protein [Pseudomonas sp. JG-B]WVK90980.1 hypothetical protein SA496_14630 [Pseudomonas sp. JS3066]
MSKFAQPLTAAALASALLAPAAWAGQNAHDEHQKTQATSGQPTNHGQMQNMDHGAMHRDKDAKPKTDRNDDQ